MKKELIPYLDSQRDRAAGILCDLIGFPSVAGQEREIQSYLFDRLDGLGLAPRYAPIDPDIARDPDYTPVQNDDYRGRHNLLVTIPGSGGGRSLILNSHSDVVPASREMFEPQSSAGIIYGRGACDAKGQVVTMLLVLGALKSLGLRLKGDLQVQIVIEEETGGNGSLSTIRQGNRADAAVVLEPTGLGVYPANRGSVWFKLGVTGKSVHMGKYYEGVSAISEMIGLIGLLREYEKRLRDESRGNPLFPDDPSPVNVNIGQIHGGQWPSTVPAVCLIEGGIAFLPNKRISQIVDEVRGLIRAKAGAWARQHYAFECSRLHNEAFETPVDHPAVKAFCEAAAAVLGPQPPQGWTASCDARLFHHSGGMPTIVFGPGDLAHAHSLAEQIRVQDMLTAARILTLFCIDWCGVQ